MNRLLDPARSIPRGIPVLASGLALMMPATAQAELRVLLQTFNPAVAPYDRLETVVQNPVRLTDLVRAGWDGVRGPACDQIKQQVRAQVLAQVGGSTLPLSELRCELASAKSATVAQSGQDLKITLGVPGNLVRMKVELDGGRPDFFVEAPFSLAITMVVTPGQQGRILTLKSADIRPTLAPMRVDGATFVGDAIVSAAGVAGLNVGKIIRDKVQGQLQVPTQTMVSGFNQAMGGTLPAAVRNAVYARMWYSSANEQLTLVFAPRFPALPRGALVGTVISGPEQPECNGVALKARARAPGTLTNLNNAPTISPVYAEAATTATGSAKAASSATVTCHFRMANAPMGGNALISATPAVGSGSSGRRPIVEGGGAYSQPNQNFGFKTAWGIPVMTQSAVKAKLPGERASTTPGTAPGNPGVRVLNPERPGSTARSATTPQKKAKPQNPAAKAAPPR